MTKTIINNSLYHSYFFCHDDQIGVTSGKSQMTSVMHQLIVLARRIVDNERNQPAAGENQLRFSWERKTETPLTARRLDREER